jgi:hypothetical protein
VDIEWMLLDAEKEEIDGDATPRRRCLVVNKPEVWVLEVLDDAAGRHGDELKRA